MTIPVIFRKLSDGGLIAFFPTIPSYPGCATSFDFFNNKHSYYDHARYSNSQVAKQEEYKHLLPELEKLGYKNLKVYRRQLSWMFDLRERNRRVTNDLHVLP